MFATACACLSSAQGVCRVLPAQIRQYPVDERKQIGAVQSSSWQEAFVKVRSGTNAPTQLQVVGRPYDDGCLGCRPSASCTMHSTARHVVPMPALQLGFDVLLICVFWCQGVAWVKSNTHHEGGLKRTNAALLGAMQCAVRHWCMCRGINDCTAGCMAADWLCCSLPAAVASRRGLPHRPSSRWQQPAGCTAVAAALCSQPGVCRQRWVMG